MANLTSDQKKNRTQKSALRDAVIHDADLMPSARVVGYKIADLVNDLSGYAFPSQEYLSEQLGFPIRTIQRATKALEAAGYFIVENEEKDRRSKRYFININHPKKGAKLSSILGDKTRIDRRQKQHRIGDKKAPLSLYDPNISSGAAKNLTLDVPDGIAVLARQDDSESDDDQFVKAAKRAGCKFVILNSEPWKAHAAARAVDGLPMPPVHTDIVRGRTCRGVYLQTLWPTVSGTRRGVA